MKLHKLFLLLSFVAAISACNQDTGSASSSTSNMEVTLSGTNGLAEVAGDKIEIKRNTVFVNGVSFGSVPAGAEVKYSVSSKGRILFVAGKRRNVSK
ncbi:MAG: hypothetical protein ISR72_08915 [Methylobacter sp.]|nr:hypothetical protein [Methylobacter sp.]